MNTPTALIFQATSRLNNTNYLLNFGTITNLIDV